VDDLGEGFGGIEGLAGLLQQVGDGEQGGPFDLRMRRGVFHPVKDVDGPFGLAGLDRQFLDAGDGEDLGVDGVLHDLGRLQQRLDASLPARSLSPLGPALFGPVAAGASLHVLTAVGSFGRRVGGLGVGRRTDEIDNRGQQKQCPHHGSCPFG
jgi:hypothetical protein